MTGNSERRRGLSKSRISAFEQCSKRLWLAVHRPELAESDEGAVARFAAGHAVGEAACSLVPDGVMVEAEPDLNAALAQTGRLIREGHDRPIFEATFQHDGVLVRADILEPDGNGGWEMAEVKSSTSPKDYHSGDLATQVWVARQAGLVITGAAIRHIDRGFVLEREGDHDGLFTDADLLAEIEPLIEGRGAVVAEARDVLAGDEPERSMGDHCQNPFACEFASHCRSRLPPGPEWPVTLLPYGGGRKWIAQGIDDLLRLDETDLSERDARILAATRTGRPYHDTEGARAAMAGWSFPRAWLDFETIAFAIPRWIGTRPYQQVPFQFSLHLEQEDGGISHHEFLGTDGLDPRGACAAALAETIPEQATIIAYSASFERRVMTALADACPEHGERLRAMVARTVDLLPVARDHWYHRDQRGSWSIKAVLTTMTDFAYAGLEVRDGGMAQQAYLEAIDPTTAPDRRLAIEEALRAYCGQDTWAMIVVARTLAGQDGFQPC